MAKVDVKIVLLGQHDVGKTSLVDQYLHGRFSTSLNTTVGAAFGAKSLMVDGKQMTLGIWDTAGSERYASMTRIYYRQAKGAIVCYDVTNGDTFAKVREWVTELRANEASCPVVVCGTKHDLVKSGAAPIDVDEEAVEEYVKSINAQHVVTSAKTGDNVSKAFEMIAREYLKNPSNTTEKPRLDKPEQHQSSADRFAITEGGQRKKNKQGGCCN